MMSVKGTDFLYSTKGCSFSLSVSILLARPTYCRVFRLDAFYMTSSSLSPESSLSSFVTCCSIRHLLLGKTVSLLNSGNEMEKAV